MMENSKDLAPARQARLREIIRMNGVARVDDICRELKASPATVRRDLETLEQQGHLRRVHGGAVSIESRLEEPRFDDKESVAAREKGLIAEQAAAMIKDGDTVYLDGGSTVLQLARLLVNRANITVVTNSLRAANALSGRGPRLILIGGELRRLSETLVGTLTTALLDQLNVDIAFMGTMGASIESGLTTSDPSEAFTKRAAMKRARKVVLLSDSNKFGQTSFANAGSLSDIHTIVTDKKLPAAMARQLRKHQIDLITV